MKKKKVQNENEKILSLLVYMCSFVGCFTLCCMKAFNFFLH